MIGDRRELLRVEGLSKTFGGLRAVIDVSFEVAEGEILGLLGPNGSGKTTVLNLIAGALRADAGRVHLADRDVTGIPASLRTPSINDGTIDTIDSDHAPHTLEDLERFKQDPRTGPFGSPQYDNMLSVLLTDVHRGKLSSGTLVRVFSENPARLLGLYPRKGALLPGSDADLVIVDLDKEWKASDETVYTKVKWTPCRG